MKTRTINQLLTIAYENIDKHLNTGLCQYYRHLCFIGLISHREKSLLLDYLDNNKPDNKYTRKGCRFYWQVWSAPPRKNWLFKHKNLTK